MAPATSLQSKISAFEALSSPATPPKAIPRKPSPRVPTNPLDAPISPTFISVLSPAPRPIDASPRSPASSASDSTRGSSVIDLKDWVVEEHPHSVGRMLQNGNGLGISSNDGHEYGLGWQPSVRTQSTPLISFGSPPEMLTPPAPPPSAPPLPPRKPSLTSLRSASDKTTTRAIKPSDSLTIEHTYPPLSATTGHRAGHAHANSASSFHSVSLSDNEGGSGSGAGTPTSAQHHNSGDGDSLDDSFENVPSNDATSPSPPSFSSMHDWDRNGKSEPPKLPQRPQSKPLLSSASSSSSIVNYAVRRPPPPPPSALSRSRPPSNRTSVASTSDRSSILSAQSAVTSRTSASTSGRSSLALARPTPVPPGAKTRFEALFAANVRESLARTKSQLSAANMSAQSGADVRKMRQAAGWRGLSVDLTTNPEENEHLAQVQGEKEGGNTVASAEDRLDGPVVNQIWTCSKLDRSKLRDIWNECDVTGQGSLDCASFVRGMWRIDEELRRAQLARHSTSGLHRTRQQKVVPNLLH